MRCRVISSMGAKWAGVQERCAGFVARIPAQGMTVEAFGALALGDVLPADWEAVVRALSRKGVLWCGSIRGRTAVFGEKPKTLARGVVDGTDAGLALSRSILPLAMALVDILAEEEAERVTGEVFKRKQRVLKAIASKRDNAVSNGVSMNHSKLLIERLFSARIVGAILSSKASVEQVNAAPKGSSNMPAHETVYRTIENERKGSTKGQLLALLRGTLDAKAIKAQLLRLEDEGYIYSVAMIADAGSYRVGHYFAASQVAPTLDSKGRRADYDGRA